MTHNLAQGLATLLAQLEAQRDQLTEQIDTIRMRLLEVAEPGAIITDSAGIPRYRVTTGRRAFSEQLARQILPGDVLAECTVTKVDGAALKRRSLPMWESCTTVGNPAVVKVAER